MGKEYEETKKFRTDNTVKLIEKYKDLVNKTFEVIDKDKLQEKIDADDSDSEQKFLDAVKKRRVALDEVGVILEKVEKLEMSIREEKKENITTTKPISFAKKHARTT